MVGVALIDVHVFTSAVVTAAATAAPPASAKCPKCVANKAGTPTCCAPGASWFQNCGPAGDSNVEHTWDEGFKVCKHSSPGAAQSQAMLFNQTNGIQQQQNGQENNLGFATVNNVYDTGTVNCRGRVKLENLITIISILLVLLMNG